MEIVGSGELWGQARAIAEPRGVGGESLGDRIEVLTGLDPEGA